MLGTQMDKNHGIAALLRCKSAIFQEVNAMQCTPFFLQLIVVTSVDTFSLQIGNNNFTRFKKASFKVGMLLSVASGA